MQNRATVFGMELYTDVESVLWNLNNFHKIVFGVDTTTLHAVFFKRCFICVVEFVTMSVPLADDLGAIYLFCSASVLHFASI